MYFITKHEVLEFLRHLLHNFETKTEGHLPRTVC